MADVTAATDEELAAQIAAAQLTIAAALKEQEARLIASRAAVLAEVQTNVRKYKITRTELASSFPQLRKSKSAATATDAPTVSATGKKRGRPRKVVTETGATE